MNSPEVCITPIEEKVENENINCHICNCQLDLFTSLTSEDINDSIYICFESIKQKIFVYGKYKDGKYGAHFVTGQYSKEECKEKKCDDDIENLLTIKNDSEYSRFTDCKRGEMKTILLTKKIIDRRKKDLLSGKLEEYFPTEDNKKKHFCHEHALENNMFCTCGEKLIQLNTEEHRELTGMDDQKFAERFFNNILKISL